jgi:hypothetical protein
MAAVDGYNGTTAPLRAALDPHREGRLLTIRNEPRARLSDVVEE